GIYVPRNLVSTLVMCAVPAEVAGVRRIVVCTPPAGAGLIAAAAELLGLEEVWALGGPQAIGWLAYVERVDKIVGPGNRYVNEAKLEVARDVAIDLPGGPSEVVVLGDGDPRLVELELNAQREHGHDVGGGGGGGQGWSGGSGGWMVERDVLARGALGLSGQGGACPDRGTRAAAVTGGARSGGRAGSSGSGAKRGPPTCSWAARDW